MHILYAHAVVGHCTPSIDRWRLLNENTHSQVMASTTMTQNDAAGLRVGGSRSELAASSAPWPLWAAVVNKSRCRQRVRELRRLRQAGKHGLVDLKNVSLLTDMGVLSRLANVAPTSTQEEFVEWMRQISRLDSRGEFSVGGRPCCNHERLEPSRWGRCTWMAKSTKPNLYVNVTRGSFCPAHMCKVACGVCAICNDHPEHGLWKKFYLDNLIPSSTTVLSKTGHHNAYHIIQGVTL